MTNELIKDFIDGCVTEAQRRRPAEAHHWMTAAFALQDALKFRLEAELRQLELEDDIKRNRQIGLRIGGAS